jgi:hypothetical protein
MEQLTHAAFIPGRRPNRQADGAAEALSTGHD